MATPVERTTQPAATFVEILAQKRDGRIHHPGDIKRLIAGLGSGELADYQMSAWLMAAFLRGLDEAETLELTDAMLGSGSVIDLSDIPGKKIDKHSTGGVGDKVSIALAPLVAACGVPVPMVSGRGLGHTGGTLDKLEAIPGFQVNLPLADFRRIVAEVGTCMIGQTAEIAPADKRIYALRDVTATVENVSLITASILSKKLAEGIDGLVLDVKVGRGAFMKDLSAARTLAESLVRVSRRGGKGVTALLTDMDHPLGRTIGNSLETAEAIAVLRGTAPADLTELTVVLAAEMLVLGGVAVDIAAARKMVDAAISSGRALDVLRRMIEAQHGDPNVVDDISKLGLAPVVKVVSSAQAGVVADVDPMVLALSALRLGAGRTRADQKVNPLVGLVLHAVQGDRAEVGAPLAEIHAASEAEAEAELSAVRSAFQIAEVGGQRGSLVIEVIRG